MFKMTEEEKKRLMEEAKAQAEKKEKEKEESIKLAIEDYKYALMTIDVLERVAEYYHGKVMNVRFERAVKEKEDVLVKFERNIYGAIIGVSFEKRFARTGWRTILYASDCIIDKRLNATAFKKKAEQWKKSLSKEQEKLENDKKTGRERVQKYNELVAELESLYKTFSTDYVDVHKYEFNSLIYAAR